MIIDADKFRHSPLRDDLNDVLEQMRDAADEAIDVLQQVADAEDPEDREYMRDNAAEALATLTDEMESVIEFIKRKKMEVE